MAKFRSRGPDVHPGTAVRNVGKPGTIADGKLGVYDHGPTGKLRLRGVVGHNATSSTAARFHKKLGSVLGVVSGKKAWIAPKPTELLGSFSGDRDQPTNAGGSPKSSAIPYAASVRAARGSVSSKGRK